MSPEALTGGALAEAFCTSFSSLVPGAVPSTAPVTIDPSFLDRIGETASFPGRAVRTGDAWLTPATCYRYFCELQDVDLDGPTRGELCGACGRNESVQDGAHLVRFTMHELVWIDIDPDALRAERDAVADATLDLAHRLGLSARLAPAEDPFFRPQDRGRRLLQRMLEMKVELLADLPQGLIALASFNLHGDAICAKAGITMSGATPSSMCAAGGIDRWAMALVSAHGGDPGTWPDPIRAELGY